MRSVLAILLSYLIGSIPFGYLIVRLRLGADIRETGSGGTGATNVSRRAGKAAGLLTLLLDAAKGAAAVLVARSIVAASSGNKLEWSVGAAAIAVLLGHIFPVWLKFRGGKGVATGVGIMAVLVPVPTLIAGVAFLITFLLTRYVSLASMTAAALLPLLVLAYNAMLKPPIDVGMILTAAAGALLIVWAHRANINRLLEGTESKFR